MTIKEFFESKNKLAIHCDTEEKACKLIRAFGKLGYAWRSGTPYSLKDLKWYYGKNTAYTNAHRYVDVDFGKKWLGYTILRVEEIEGLR